MSGPWNKLDAATNRRLIGLKDRIVSKFNESQWLELAAMTNHFEEVQQHPRLLRSLSFGDNDYAGCVLVVLQDMVKSDPDNLAVIENYVRRTCPEDGEFISSEDSGGRRIVFSPNVFQVPDVSVDESLVSVMMPFDSAFDGVYDAIKAATIDAGFTCKRVDDIWDASTIIQDVFSLIFQSYVVVCDFSGQNANVFYEAGIAHTLGKHVIPLAQSKHDVPFDLRHHKYAQYHNNNEGRANLQERLTSRLRTLAAKRKMPWDW